MFDTLFKIIFYRSHKSKCKYLRRHKAKIGNNVRMFISVNHFGSEPWLVEIGNNVLISFGVYFVTHDGGISVIKNMYPEKKGLDRLGKITIGNNVFIGCNSIIMLNAVIPDNVIIGAGSVVTDKAMQPNSVYAGVPAKRICSIDEYYEKHLGEYTKTSEMTSKQKRAFYENCKR